MNYFQQEKDILNLAILDWPYLELGKILPMLAFWIVTTDNGTNQHQQEVEHVWL